MSRCLHLISTFALLSSLAGTAAGAQQPKPIRQLVYSFDFSVTQDRTVHSSGVGEAGGGTGSGMTHYPGGNSDKGTITVDVLGLGADTGLAVMIAEQGRGDRTAAPAECVAYPIGSVLCQTDKKVNEEEMTLLRMLGRNFVNPSQLDLKKHWQNVNAMPGGKEVNDYTITSDDNNGLLGISYVRALTIEGVNGFRADTNGTLTYNQKLSVPVKIKEDTVTRRHVSQGTDDRIEQQMTLTLTTDSLASATS